MKLYRFAGQEFSFLQPVPELKPFEITEIQGTADDAVPCFLSDSSEPGGLSPLHSPTCQTIGWVAGKLRLVRIYEFSNGTILEIEDGGKFFITSDGQTIGKMDIQGEMAQLDYEVMAGSVFTLALAMRGVWSLHASAAIYKGRLVVILGESGKGKSTLAGYLGETGWQRVADDILPVASRDDSLLAFPHYPQLKISSESQPWLQLPEQIPVQSICLLMPVNPDDSPALGTMSPGDFVKVMLAHTAGTRLLSPDLLKDHLAFCTRAALQIPTYRLSYPHRKEVLPQVRELLEEIC